MNRACARSGWAGAWLRLGSRRDVWMRNAPTDGVQVLDRRRWCAALVVCHLSRVSYWLAGCSDSAVWFLPWRRLRRQMYCRLDGGADSATCPFFLQDGGSTQQPPPGRAPQDRQEEVEQVRSLRGGHVEAHERETPAPFHHKQGAHSRSRRKARTWRCHRP